MCSLYSGYDELQECLGANCATGCFESRNYPDPYINDHSKLYLLQVPGANSITFTCNEAFVIEEDRDVLFAGAGLQAPFPLDVNSQNVQMFDGNMAPTFTITGNAAWLFFTTDRVINQQGWQCCWHAGMRYILG